MSDVVTPPPNPTRSSEPPVTIPLVICTAVSAGIICGLAGFAAPPVLLYSLFFGPAGIVAIALFLGLVGLLVGGLDLLITGRGKTAGRAALVVLAMVLVIAALIGIDYKATGGHPSNWWLLAPFAGVSGLGTSLLINGRAATMIAGVVVLAVVGGFGIAVIEKAKADNGYLVYEIYDGLGTPSSADAET